MEAHQIPQNVTTFQFRLIGDMTIKQFGYLAIGVSLAYIIFVFFAVNYPLVSWPLIFLSGFLGFAFAFVPIGSRPLDYWLAAFLKAIYSPTKRVWKKDNKNFQQDPLFKSRFLMFLPSLTAKNTPLIPTPAQSVIYSQQPTPTPPQPQTVIQTQPLPSKEELSKTVELARQAQSLQVKIIQTERQLTQLRTQPTSPQESVTYTRQVNGILEELQKLVNQGSAIRQELDQIQQPPKQPQIPATPAATEVKPKIKITVPARPKQTQLALTSFPNVINGIIKDASGNYLDGVIVVIHDKEGMPVRALKTNKLGQFSGSTPLPNGIYTMEIEKEGCNFDVLQIELEGQIIPPLLVTAKG